MPVAKRNVREIVQNRLCLGCGTCLGVCPVDAITLEYSTENRTYIPSIEEAKCNNCGICYDICPGKHIHLPKLHREEIQDPRMFAPEFGEYMKCFVGYANDPDLRYKAASGGITSALSIFLLEKGRCDAVIATQMKKGSIFETEPVLCRSQDDIHKCMGSKYCPSAVNAAFAKSELIQCKSICLIGLPCHIQGLMNAKGYNPLKSKDKVLSIGLLCGGMRGREGSLWILKKKNIPLHMISDIRSHRCDGWPGKMKISLKGSKEIIEIEYPYDYDEYFESWQPWRCFLCLDRAAELSDISLGDAWLPEYREDKQGTSIIIARTEDGLNLIEEAVNNNIITARELGIDLVIKAQAGLWNDIENEVRAALFFSQLLRKSIPDYRISFQNPGWDKLYRLVKKIARSWVLRKLSG